MEEPWGQGLLEVILRREEKFKAREPGFPRCCLLDPSLKMVPLNSRTFPLESAEPRKSFLPYSAAETKC